MRPQVAQGEEAEERRDREGDAAEHEHAGERGRRGDAEAGEPRGEGGFGDADPAGDGRDVADHSRAHLHDDQLGEVEPLVEGEQADAEDRGVDQVAGEVTADELQRLPRIADHRPDVAGRTGHRGHDLAPDLGDGEDDPDRGGDRAR